MVYAGSYYCVVQREPGCHGITEGCVRDPGIEGRLRVRAPADQPPLETVTRGGVEADQGVKDTKEQRTAIHEQ